MIIVVYYKQKRLEGNILIGVNKRLLDEVFVSVSSADNTYLNIDNSCNCVNNKMLEYDWFLTAYIYNGSRT